MSLLLRLFRFNNIGLLILRLGVGIIFIEHGMLKWGMWGMQPSEQLQPSMLMTLKVLSIAEPLGGLAMILGLWTLPAGIGMAVVMVAVISMKINVTHVGFIAFQTTGWELDFLVLCSVLSIIFTGPGRFSVERLLSKE